MLWLTSCSSFSVFFKKVFSKMIAIKFTALGLTGPIHLTATERPKLTDLGGPTKPNQSSWWNLPRITLRTCHWLCPNSPYMWPTRMRRTRVWSSLTSVPRSISLSRTALLSQTATGRPAKHRFKPWKPARLKETKMIRPNTLYLQVADIIKWSAWMSVFRRQEAMRWIFLAIDGH